MPEIESGAIAAAVPIVAPAINRIRGIETIRRMMNGSERNPFTNAPITLFALALSQMPPAAVPPRTAPSTTELGYLARINPKFDKRNVKIIGLSRLDSRPGWAADMKETQVHAPNFRRSNHPARAPSASAALLVLSAISA